MNCEGISFQNCDTKFRNNILERGPDTFASVFRHYALVHDEFNEVVSLHVISFVQESQASSNAGSAFG